MAPATASVKKHSEKTGAPRNTERPHATRPVLCAGPGWGRTSSGAGGADLAIGMPPLTGNPDAWIEPGVGNIDYDVDHDDERRGEEHHRLGDWVVPDEHGIHQQSADPRPGKDGLRHHRTRDELRKIHGKQRKNRYGGVLQGMLP